MKMKMTVVAALSALCFTLPVHAQFGGLSNMIGGGKAESGPAVDSDAVKKSVTTALISLVRANEKYADSLGNEKSAASLKTVGDGLANGSMGVNADVISQIKTASAELAPQMKKNLEEKTKASSAGQKAAAEGLVFHVKGTLDGVDSSKMLKKAFESRSPAVLSALASLKDFPGLFSQWTSTTGSVISYLQFNGLDTTEAKKKIANSMKDAG